MSRRRDVLVIGGATFDITSRVRLEALLYDSNPSTIYGGCGGVGRNIAENMARMGLGVGFISAFGTDVFSEKLIKSCHQVQIDTSRAFITHGASACKSVAILDNSGELLIAAADTDLLENIAIEHIKSITDYIRLFPLVFVDANITETILPCIAEIVEGQIFADAVSIRKAPRINSILSCIDTLKLNLGELESLSGYQTHSLDSVRQAIQFLLNKGVRRVFVTMGTEGCCCCEGDVFETLRSFPVEIKNVTGAGDAFAAAIVYGSLNGYSNREILLIGTAASHIALMNERAVSDKLNESLLLEVYQELKYLNAINKNSDINHYM